MYNKVRILHFGRNKSETTGEETSFNNEYSVIGSSNFSLCASRRTDANGGHTCRTNCEKWGLQYGEYHYHNKPASSSGATSPAPSQNNNSAVEAERQAEAQRNTEAEKQRNAEAQRKAEEERQRVAEEQRKAEEHVNKRKRSAKLIWKKVNLKVKRMEKLILKQEKMMQKCM